jgi:hypothetical protein
MYNVAKNRVAVLLLAVVALMLTVFSGSSYGSLVDTFDPANPAVTATAHAVVAPVPTVTGGGPTGNFLRLVADGTNGLQNSYAYDRTDPGTFPGIDAEFDFRISSVDQPADGFSFMLIPTAVYGNSGSGAYTLGTPFEVPNFAGVFGVGFDIYPLATNLLTVHWNNTQVGSVALNPAAVDLVAGVFHRVDLSLVSVPGGANLSLSLVPDVYGTPGVPVAAFSDLFIAGLSPYEYRVQFGGRTGGLNASIDLDNVNVTPIPTPSAILLGGLGTGFVTWLRRRRML